MGMSAIILEPVFALVDGVLELCFPRTLVNAMLPNAIYRISDSTRTECIIWKYIVAKNRNVLFEFTISSLKYVYILFDRDAALMPVPQKSRTNRAGWSRCPSSFWPGECTQQGVALSIGWGFAYVCWVWSTMTHNTVWEVSSHVNRGRVQEQDRHIWRHQNMWTLLHCSQEATRHMSRFSCSWYIHLMLLQEHFG